MLRLNCWWLSIRPWRHVNSISKEYEVAESLYDRFCVAQSPDTVEEWKGVLVGMLGLLTRGWYRIDLKGSSLVLLVKANQYRCVLVIQAR